MEAPRCLQCQEPLEQDFGISTCTKCGSMMMIDMNGQVQRAQGSQTSNVEQEQNSIDEFVNSVTDSSLKTEESDLPAATPDETNFFSDQKETEAAEQGISVIVKETEPEQNQHGADLNWFDQQLDQPGEPEVLDETSREAFSEIASFANQDQEVDAIQFEVILSGIDHKDLAYEVSKVLSDPRLFLPVKDLVPQNGVITISGLSAARAQQIVVRLKHLNLQIHWNQKLYEN